MSSKKNKKVSLEKNTVYNEEINEEIKSERRKRKTNVKKKNRSIALQLSVGSIFSKLSLMIIFDVLYIALSICGFCFCAQRQYSIESWNFAMGSFNYDNSEVELDDTVRLMLFPFSDDFDIEFYQLNGALQSVSYSFTDSSGAVRTVPAGDFFLFLYFTMCALLIIELVVFLFSCIIIPIKINKRLKPLYTMTAAAQVLTNIDPSDESFATLQDAINKMSGSEARLHTGRKELVGLESAVNDLLDRVRSSYKTQTRFVSDASHELRTPIAVIQGYANMLDRWGREDPEILDESITAIKGEADNMNRLVENLLFLARGDSGKTTLRIDTVDINQLLCDIYDEFVMIDSDHEFRLDLRCEVKGEVDMSLIKQCLRILIDNAIKYSPKGSDIIMRLQKRENNFYSIEIQDYGIGINKEDAGKVFERFYRSDPARNRQTGGSGLGLSIAKWIVEKHKGYIELLSYEDLGTRMSVVLPLNDLYV